MTLRKLLFCGVACGLAFLASCSSNKDEDNEIATQVADGTLPPWLAESGDGAAYTAVSSDSPSTYKSKRSASSSTAPKSTASRSGKSSSKSVASRSGKKSSSAKGTAGRSSRKSSAKPSYYTVQKGDSIDRIARRYKCSNKALMKANGLKSDLIHPGKKLRIP